MKRYVKLMVCMPALIALSCDGSSNNSSNPSDTGAGTALTVISGTFAGDVTDRTWASWLTSNGYTTTSGLYAQVVVCDDVTRTTLETTLSNKSEISADGSFTLTLAPVPAAYLGSIPTLPAGVTASASNARTLADRVYVSEIWVFTSSGAKVGTLKYRTNALETKPYTRADLGYFSAAVTITGTSSGPTLLTIDYSFVPGWNWFVGVLTTDTQTMTSSTSAAISGLKWYLN